MRHVTIRLSFFTVMARRGRKLAVKRKRGEIETQDLPPEMERIFEDLEREGIKQIENEIK
jgi:hypothetical protein